MRIEARLEELGLTLPPNFTMPNAKLPFELGARRGRSR